jgi:hypothetical protein
MEAHASIRLPIEHTSFANYRERLAAAAQLGPDWLIRSGSAIPSERCGCCGGLRSVNIPTGSRYYPSHTDEPLLRQLLTLLSFVIEVYKEPVQPNAFTPMASPSKVDLRLELASNSEEGTLSYHVCEGRMDLLQRMIPRESWVSGRIVSFHDLIGAQVFIGLRLQQMTNQSLDAGRLQELLGLSSPRFVKIRIAGRDLWLRELEPIVSEGTAKTGMNWYEYQMPSTEEALQEMVVSLGGCTSTCVPHVDATGTLLYCLEPASVVP